MAVLPPDRDRVGVETLRGERVGDRLAGDLEFAPVMVRGAGVVELRPEQHRQQLVAGRFTAGRFVAGQDEVHLETQPGPGGRRHPAVVRLGGADRDERLGVRVERGATQELELARLVAAAPEAAEVVTLHQQSRPAGKVGPTSSGVGSVASTARGGEAVTPNMLGNTW